MSDRAAFDIGPSVPRAWRSPGVREVDLSVMAVSVVLPLILAGMFVMMNRAGIAGETASRVEMVAMGANAWELTTRGEWWRLVVSSLVDVNGMLLWLSMVMLALLGGKVQMLFGQRLFCIIVLGGILSGALATVWVVRDAVGFGAGPIVLALAGAVIGCKLRHWDRGMLATLWSLVKWLGMTLVMAVFMLIRGEGVNNAGLLAGLVFGVVAGCCLAPPRDRDLAGGWIPWAAALGMAVICAGTLVAVVTVPRSEVDLEARYRFMAARAKLGQQATEVWRYLADTNKLYKNRIVEVGVSVAEIRGTAIPAWDEAFGKVLSPAISSKDEWGVRAQAELAEVHQAGRKYMEALAVKMTADGPAPRADEYTIESLKKMLEPNEVDMLGIQVGHKLAELREAEDPYKRPVVQRRR